MLSFSTNQKALNEQIIGSVPGLVGSMNFCYPKAQTDPVVSGEESIFNFLRGQIELEITTSSQRSK